MSKNTKQTILPLIIAAIWGLAFIAQSAGLIPLALSIPGWFPMAIGWCFIALGLVLVVRQEKAKKNAEKKDEEQK